MLEGYLVQECDLISTTKNSYGDYIYQTTATLACRWRDIPTVIRGSHNELNDADSMVWLAPDSLVVKGSILKFEGYYYQVERLNSARRLGEGQIQFLKCDVKVLNIGIS
jgi:hypothetical protein